MTAAGRLDIIFEPAGTQGFEDLRAGAVRFDVTLLVASLADLLRSKQATDRVQDRQDVVMLRALIERERESD